jgi:hypothetical protein
MDYTKSAGDEPSDILTGQDHARSDERVSDEGDHVDFMGDWEDPKVFTVVGMPL